jgi:hypothetical protein
VHAKSSPSLAAKTWTTKMNSRLAPSQNGGTFLMEKIMTTEIPEDVLAAIKAVVDWSHGCDGPDEILEHDIPILDAGLVKIGLLLPPDLRPLQLG